MLDVVANNAQSGGPCIQVRFKDTLLLEIRIHNGTRGEKGDAMISILKDEGMLETALSSIDKKDGIVIGTL